MDILTSADRGSFIIATRSRTTYLIDLSKDAASMTRVLSKTQGTDEALRRDSEELRIHDFDEIRVGQPCVFHLDPLSDSGALYTIRRISPVKHITRLA